MKSGDTVTRLVKPVSYDCNISCSYCFYSQKSTLYPDEDHPRMSEKTLSTLTEKALSTGAQSVSFIWQGGEPTLTGLEFYRKAVAHQELYRYPTQKISNSIQTNGILIDNEWTKFLKRENWLVGVSLDGDRVQHNAYRLDRRGGGTYDGTRKALRLLQFQKVPYNILVLLNNVNVRAPKRLYSDLKGAGHRYLQFIPCIEYDLKNEPTEYSITAEEYGNFLVEVFDEWVKDIPNVFVRDFEDIMIGEVTGASPNCVYSGECGQYLVVEYNGDVYPCDFFVETEWLLGNIHTDSLEELIDGKKFNEFIAKRQLSSDCESCPWLRYCHGGCQKHMRTDRNYFCDSYKTFFEHAHEKIQIMKKSLAH